MGGDQGLYVALFAGPTKLANDPAEVLRRKAVLGLLGAMLETCGSAGKDMKEGVPSRMIES